MRKRYTTYEYRKGQFLKISQNSELNQYLKSTYSPRNMTYRVNMPPTWMEINLSNIGKNIHALFRYLGRRIPIIAIVKCDAYGHGLVPICLELVRQGVSKFGVASLSEAEEIRLSRINTPIVMLYPFLEHHVPLLVKYGIEITINNIENLEWVLDYAQKNIKEKIKVHLSFRVGIDSEGMRCSEFNTYKDCLISTKNITIEGICGVLSNENPNKFSLSRQLEIFRKIVEDLYMLGIIPNSVHIANSESVDIDPDSLDKITMIDRSIPCYVRLGRWLYGTYTPVNTKIGKLYPVLSSIKSRVVQVRKIGPNESVGYFGLYKAKTEEVIATIPFGWGSSGVLLKDVIIRYKGYNCHQVGVMSANALHFRIESKIKLGDQVKIVDTASTIPFNWNNLEKCTNAFVSQIISQLGAKIPRVYFLNINTL